MLNHFHIPLKGTVQREVLLKRFREVYRLVTTRTQQWLRRHRHKIWRYLGSNSNNQKMQNLGWSLCVDVCRLWEQKSFLKKYLISNFPIEYLRNNAKVCETVFASSLGSQIEYLKQKRCQISRDSVPLRSAAPERVGLGMTIVLTLTTHMANANSNLPKTSYPKVRQTSK